MPELERAALVAGFAGRGPLLERDSEQLARGVRALADRRADPAAYALARASRRSALFVGAEEALARLLRAADEGGVARERALQAAVLGLLRQTVPRLNPKDGPPGGARHAG